MSTCAIEGCEKRHLARGWCNMHYQRWKKHGDPLGGRTQYRTAEESFSARTERRGDCLIWTGTRNNTGYGCIRFNNRYMVAHRYAWERENGPVPEGMDLDHICWERSCCEVAHLRVVTHAENMGNRSGANSNSISGIRGIYQAPSGTYYARIDRNGKRYRQSFVSKTDAIGWLEAKRDEIYGEYGGRLIAPREGTIDNRN